MMTVHIEAPDRMIVSVTVGGRYSPDVLLDAVARARELFTGETRRPVGGHFDETVEHPDDRNETL